MDRKDSFDSSGQFHPEGVLSLFCSKLSESVIIDGKRQKESLKSVLSVLDD